MINVKMQPDKKGDSRILFFYWFIIMILVAGSMVMAYNSFYSAKLDVRKAEAQILNDKITDGFIGGGRLSEIGEEIYNIIGTWNVNEGANAVGEGGGGSESENIEGEVSNGREKEEIIKEKVLSSLNLNLKDESYEGEQYLVFLKFWDFDSCTDGNCREIRTAIIIGNDAYPELCRTQEIDGEKAGLPKCQRNKVYVLSKSGKKLVLEVLTSVSKGEQNVK